MATSTPNIGAGFSNENSIFGIGELGGSYDTKGTGTQTQTQSVTFTIDPNAVGQTAGELILGLYNGTLTGNAASLMSGYSLAVTWQDVANSGTGGTLFSASGNSSAAVSAKSIFTDDFVVGSDGQGLGNIATIDGGNAFTVTISLSETFNGANAGFYGSFILGDPPVGGTATAEPAGHPAVASLASALFEGFFAPSGTDAANAPVVPSAPHLTATASANPFSMQHGHA